MDGIYKKLGDQLRLHPGGQFKILQEEKKIIASMQYSLLEVGVICLG